MDTGFPKFGGWDPTASVGLSAERMCIAVSFNELNLFTVFICVCVHMCVGACVCRCMCVHALCAGAFVYKYMSVLVHVYVGTHLCMRVYVHVCVGVHVCGCKYMYVHKCECM